MSRCWPCPVASAWRSAARMPTAAYMPANRSATGTPTCPAHARLKTLLREVQWLYAAWGRDLLRLALRLAGDAHKAAHGLHHHVVPRAVPARLAASLIGSAHARTARSLVRPGLAEAGNAAVD